MGLHSRLARLEAVAPEHPAAVSLRAWFDRACAEDPEAAAAYGRAVDRARVACIRAGERPVGHAMFRRLERDPDWEAFVMYGLELSAERGELPYWLRQMEGDSVGNAAEWVAWLREQGAEDAP